MLLISTALAGAIAFQLGMEPPRLTNHGSPPYTGAQARSKDGGLTPTMPSKQGAINTLLAARDIVHPNKELTPGASRTTNKNEICGTMGRKPTTALRLYNRDKGAFDERASSIFSQYELERTPAYTLDHLIPLGIGGADGPENIWPQPKAQALLKDKIEFWMRDQVCNHTGGMSDADSSELIKLLQNEIARDWYAAFKHYLGK